MISEPQGIPMTVGVARLLEVFLNGWLDDIVITNVFRVCIYIYISFANQTNINIMNDFTFRVK